MTNKERFQERYKSGNAPWDIGKPDFNLIDVVTKRPIPGCKALEIGCGTGDNAIWLAQNHFRVFGTDASDIAIEKAEKKAAEAGVQCCFMVMDFLEADISEKPFGFIFDRGCFHTFSTNDDRERFARNAAFHLEDGGLWFTIVGNADEIRERPGPPQRTAGEIISAVEPYFEILFLETSYFESSRSTPPRAWKCLMQKRRRF